MNNHTAPYCLFLMTILIFASENVCAQQTNDEFKLKLKQSLKTKDIDLKPELKYQPFDVKQDDGEVLKVSLTTKLPTKFDRIQLLHPDYPEIHLDLNVTNLEKNLATDKTDYSNGKLVPVPDARSISQFTQYTGQGAGGLVTGDFDPVRAIQNYKAKKRKEKVDKIKKAYGQE